CVSPAILYHAQTGGAVSRRPLSLVSVLAFVVAQATAAQVPSAQTPVSHSATINKYCVTCHNQKLLTSGVSLESADVTNVPAGAELWEKVIRKLRTRTMPPAGMPRPDAATYDSLASYLENEIERAAAVHPNPGRTETLHRLNRTEYQNAIRDLLALDI